MRTSIATVSMGGSLREKLEAVAAARFDGVELFEIDLLAFEGAPREAGDMIRDHGLEIVALQPFRDFEGMPPDRRARTLQRAERKLDLMVELGAPALLVCSNISPHSLGGVDRAAEDLRALGELAKERDLQIGFEALAWGRHVSDYRDAWEIVRRADHPNVGVILDSFHMFAKGLSADAMRSIPADRITFVQVADAPRLDMDLLQWSRHFRCFPGQGDLPVGEFMQALEATGYDGWLSLEIFNDRFRMASPRGIAADGERSLIWLMDSARGPVAAPARKPLPAAPKITGVAFVEFAVDEENAADLETLFAGLGFRRAGRHRSKQVSLWRQGAINLVLNADPEGFGHSHCIVHGPSVSALGFVTDNAEQMLDRAETLLAQTYRQPVGPGEVDAPAIRGHGGPLLYFFDQSPKLARIWESEFELGGAGAHEDAGLESVDHIAQTIPFEEFASWRLFYLSILGFDKTEAVDVVDPSGVVESQVLRAPDRAVQITLNAAQGRNTQAGRFIEEYLGAGVQHVAFKTEDIFAAVEKMRAAGVELLPAPANYYDDIEARFDVAPELLDRLRALDILYDEDETGRYFQVYTRVFADLFFFEVVQREGYDGFGAANAPIRLAAQARLARHPTLPRAGDRGAGRSEE